MGNSIFKVSGRAMGNIVRTEYQWQLGGIICTLSGSWGDTGKVSSVVIAESCGTSSVAVSAEY
jgi:hypothetical protein